MPELTNLVFMKAKAGAEDELRARLLELSALTRQEEGCEDYHLHSSNNDPGTWMIYESWRQPSDFEDHMRQPYMTAIVQDLPRLVDGNVEIRPFTLVSNFSTEQVKA